MFKEGLKWNRSLYNKYLDLLKSNIDIKYRDFNKKLIFTKDKVLGVRTPSLRKIAKDISKTDICSFLDLNTDTYYEEKMVYGFVLGYLKDKKTFDRYLYQFIEKIDNWAICDMCISSFKIMKRDNSYYDVALDLIKSEKEFYIRAGLIIMLDHYVDDIHIKDILKQVDKINTDMYYVNMARAWLISICFIKYKEETLKYLKNNNLDKFTYNKAISKMCDSYRVSLEDKEMLKYMKK